MSQITILFLLCCAVMPLEMPTGGVALSSVTTGHFVVGDSLLTLHVSKNRKGYLGFGFGEDMDQGDVFILEPSGDSLSIKNCITTGHKLPDCDGQEAVWKLEEAKVNSDGTWIAKITRDITKEVNGIKVIDGFNDMIISHADVDTVTEDQEHKLSTSFHNTLAINIKENTKKGSAILSLLSSVILIGLLMK